MACFVTTVNTNTQNFVTAGTVLSPGNEVASSGCSLRPSGTGISLRGQNAQYHAEAKVTFVPTVIGTVTVQLLLNGVVLPCSVTQLTVAAGDTYTVFTDAAIFAASCCSMIQPVLSAQILGADGTVSYVCMNVTRIS